MSIVKAVLELCSESWICHSCGPQDACSGRISRGKTKLSRLVKDAPKPHVVVDLDCVRCLKEKGRCDFLYFADDTRRRKQWFAPIEASRSKHKDAKDVQRQLQLSANAVAKSLNYSKAVEFLPVFAGFSRESREIRKMTVRYRGKDAWIRVLDLSERICDYMK